MQIVLCAVLLWVSRSTSGTAERENELGIAEGSQLWEVMRGGEFELSLDVDSRLGERPALSIEVAGRRVFALDIDTTRNEISLSLPVTSGSLRVLSIRAPLHTQEKHHVVLRVDNSTVELFANCRRLYFLQDADLHFTQSGVSLVRVFSLGPAQTEHNLRAVPISEAPFICSNLEIMLDNKPITTQVGMKTESQVTHLLESLIRTYQRLGIDEKSEKTCMWHQKPLTAGQRAVDFESCEECACAADGKVTCGPLGCPPVNCSRPESAPGECCPVCRQPCEFESRTYEHGEETHPRSCVNCRCEDGEMRCSHQNPSSCPALNCTEQLQPENFCCPVCENRDYCAEANPCGKYATCLNRHHRAECQCELGFIGNGTHCFDMDECKWSKDAREQLGGCADGASCVNLPGSFRCDCLPGYVRVNERLCLNLIRF